MFVVQDAVNSQMRASVREGHVDVGICMYEGEEPGLVFQDWFEDDLNVVCRPGRPLHSAKRITLNELKRVQLMRASLRRIDCPRRFWRQPNGTSSQQEGKCDQHHELIGGDHDALTLHHVVQLI